MNINNEKMVIARAISFCSLSIGNIEKLKPMTNKSYCSNIKLNEKVNNKRKYDFIDDNLENLNKKKKEL